MSNNFFNLRLIKYPLSLLIMGIGVAIYLVVFPPKKEEQTADFGLGAINLKLANSDTTITEKKVVQFADNQAGTNPNVYLGTSEAKEQSARDAQIIRENKEANFRRRTAYTPETPRYAYQQPAPQYNSRTYESPHVSNANAFNANEAKTKANSENATIEKLRKRLAELETKPKQDSSKVKNNTAEISGKKYDKNGFLILDKSPVEEVLAYAPKSNGFYSNGKTVKEVETQPTMISRSGKRSNSPLVKGRLVEDKTVRDNSSIKIMVSEPAVVNGFTLEKGQVILGKCTINGDRLMITINGYVKEDNFYPLEGKVLDMDGGDGLSINSSYDMKQSKRAWGQNASSALGSVNPLLVYQPTGNIGTTVANQVVGSLVNQSLNGANQFLNAKMQDVKANIKTGQLVYIQLKN
jgi:hypothetical protein